MFIAIIGSTLGLSSGDMMTEVSTRRNRRLCRLLHSSSQAMDAHKVHQQVSHEWDASIVPTLIEYCKIPNQRFGLRLFPFRLVDLRYHMLMLASCC
jgi:hypothetical protein